MASKQEGSSSSPLLQNNPETLPVKESQSKVGYNGEHVKSSLSFCWSEFNSIVERNGPVSTPLEGVTRERRTTEEETEIETKDVKEEVEYKIKIIDTVSIRDLKIDAKNILKEIQYYLDRKAPEGVNLFLFVISKGIFSEEEKETFDNIIARFQENVKQISALIVTGCEGPRNESREEEIGAIRKEKSTKSLTEFMDKGVHVVGFPDVQDILPELKEVYEEGIKTDAEKLRQVVLGSKDPQPDMIKIKMWEKISNYFSGN